MLHLFKRNCLFFQQDFIRRYDFFPYSIVLCKMKISIATFVIWNWLTGFSFSANKKKNVSIKFRNRKRKISPKKEKFTVAKEKKELYGIFDFLIGALNVNDRVIFKFKVAGWVTTKLLRKPVFLFTLHEVKHDMNFSLVFSGN